METINELITTKQYKNKQIQFLAGPSNCEIRTDANLFSACAPVPSQASGSQNFVSGYQNYASGSQNYAIGSQNYGNEALDLSLFEGQNDDGIFRKRFYNPSPQGGLMGAGRVNICRIKREFVEPENVCQYISPPTKKRRKNKQSNDYALNHSEVLNPQRGPNVLEISREVLGEIYDKASSPEALENSADARVEEVMKAAKSLFSKRTRTLYHWMHPNAPKQQIKSAVSASWESLGTQEKQFYISQVLGRFGFPQCNLMINPQLGGIKELPPLPDITDFNDISTDELQNAISSITTDGNVFLSESPFQSNIRQFSRKKRLGRPPGSKNRKSITPDPLKNPISHDFQDDPELSEELQQFAMNLNIP